MMRHCEGSVILPEAISSPNQGLLRWGKHPPRNDEQLYFFRTPIKLTALNANSTA